MLLQIANQFAYSTIDIFIYFLIEIADNIQICQFARSEILSDLQFVCQLLNNLTYSATPSLLSFAHIVCQIVCSRVQNLQLIKQKLSQRTWQRTKEQNWSSGCC